MSSCGKWVWIPLLDTCLFPVTKTPGQDVLNHATKALLAPPSPPILRESRKSMTTLFSSSSSTKASSMEHDLLFANWMEIVSNGPITMGFEKRTGKMQWIASSGVNISLEQIWGYYTLFDHAFDCSDVPSLFLDQCLGAYIFCPSTPTQTICCLSPRSATFVNTSVGTKVHVQFWQPWIHSTSDTHLFQSSICWNWIQDWTHPNYWWPWQGICDPLRNTNFQPGNLLYRFQWSSIHATAMQLLTLMEFRCLQTRGRKLLSHQCRHVLARRPGQHGRGCRSIPGWSIAAWWAYDAVSTLRRW